MRTLLIWIGRVAGIAGVAIIGLAIAARLVGAYFLGGFQVGTLLQAGMAATLLACLAYLAVLAEKPRS